MTRNSKTILLYNSTMFTIIIHRRIIFLRCIAKEYIIVNLKRPYTIHRKTRNVLLFPGQGSQFVGMAKTMVNSPVVKQMFDTANGILGYDLLSKCLNGPKEELDMTMFCQPAIFVTSLAALEKYKEAESLSDSENVVAAGFSVGEFAAQVLSKSLTFEDALRIVDIRAKAMQTASDVTPSGMVTVTGLDEQEVKRLIKSTEDYAKKEGKCTRTPRLVIANYLHSKGFVLAGHKEDIDYVLKFGVNKHGANMTSELAVSGAFHTQLMESARAAVTEALADVNVTTPQISVYSNVTGKLYESSEDIKRLLPRQLVEPVKWHDIMRDICSTNVEQRFYELGPGRQLTSILAKIDRRLVRKCKNIEV